MIDSATSAHKGLTDPREVAEDYRGELFRMGRHRVAVCRGGLQWLFQRRRLQFAAGGAAWDTLGYCVTRNGLIALHRAYGVPQHAMLAGLPAQFRSEGA